jgi:hypothetical protein
MNIKDINTIDIVLQKNKDEYKNLHENQQKRNNTINYDIACETKHILPPNLRQKLEPYNWPKSIDPDTIKTINEHEQAIWKEALERIANIRHQTIVDDLERITYRISFHQSEDHIRVQLLESIPDIANHPDILAEKIAQHTAFISTYIFIPKPKTYTNVQSLQYQQHNLQHANHQHPSTASRSPPHRLPNSTPTASINHEPHTAPIKSNMKRARTSNTSAGDLTDTQQKPTTPNQLAIQLNQLTSMFQSLITKVDLLEQRTSRPTSRTSSPNPQRPNHQQYNQPIFQQNGYQHNQHNQLPQNPPPPPTPYNYSPPSQHHYYPQSNQYYAPTASNDIRKVHYN